MSATNGDRSAARDLVCSSLEGMDRETIERYCDSAERAPAFAAPMLLLAGVASEVLDQADREGVPHAAALEVFTLRVYSRRSTECAVVDRVLAGVLRQLAKRRTVQGSAG